MFVCYIIMNPKVFLSLIFLFRLEFQEAVEHSDEKLDGIFQPLTSSAIIVLADKKPPKKATTTTTVAPSLEHTEHINCEEAVLADSKSSLHLIKLPTSHLGSFYVTCEPGPEGSPAWTLIQRHSLNSAVDFNGNWDKYKEGIGNLNGDFFLGLPYIHALTHSEPHELWIQLENAEGIQFNAYYNLFAIGDENQDFPLIVLGKHSGNIDDALRAHVGQKFSTFDRDNDSSKSKHCAKQFFSGWWFHNCTTSNLNGNFENNPNNGQGILWGQPNKFKKSSMLIRPVLARLNEKI